MNVREIILITHNLRSCHNVGSLLRTVDGLGVDRIYLTGYTPYPAMADDSRLPHEAAKIGRQIHKTALGAEDFVAWEHAKDVHTTIRELKAKDFTVAALEQVRSAIPLPDFQPPDKVAIVVGREVEGLEPDVLNACDFAVEIPMLGNKESFNVVQAAAMAMYHCRYPGRLH